MDAWNAKMPIKDKICGKLWKTVQYLSIMAVVEAIAIMVFMFA